MKDCCKSTRSTRRCKRKSDGTVFDLPRKFTRKRCLKGVRGFSMRSSCAPYKGCGGGGNKSKKSKGIATIDMNGIKGTVKFETDQHGRTRVNYHILHLSDGYHGFHIHRCGDMSRGCSSACEHFNPDDNKHGGPYSAERHAGDLGNIQSHAGVAKGNITVKNLSCDPCSKYSVIGRMVVVHADKDDLGRGGDVESTKTGNAGERVACAVIGIY